MAEVTIHYTLQNRRSLNVTFQTNDEEPKEGEVGSFVDGTKVKAYRVDRIATYDDYDGVMINSHLIKSRTEWDKRIAEVLAEKDDIDKELVATAIRLPKTDSLDAHIKSLGEEVLLEVKNNRFHQEFKTPDLLALHYQSMLRKYRQVQVLERLNEQIKKGRLVLTFAIDFHV